MCGGPSANQQPLEQLAYKGVFTFAVNNVAAHPRVRPQAFVCSDPPKKFSYSIWADPGILKFIPTPKFKPNRSKLRKKELGAFINLPQRTSDCPNVWGFKRHSWLWPDERFFLSDGACWGNHEAGVRLTDQPKTVSTMFLGLRILYYLGAREIYLLGVDFHMTPQAGYSFGQGRDQGASDSNNHAYGVINNWFCQLQQNGTFAKFGLTIYNTYEYSGLRAFAYLPFEQAIRRATKDIEQFPDLSDWYNS